MKNRFLFCTLSCALFCGLLASQDDPFTMTHAQRVAQENARRIAAAQIICEKKSKKIAERFARQQAFVAAKRQAEAEKRAVRIAALQAELPESLLQTLEQPSGKPTISTLDGKNLKPVIKTDNQAVAVIHGIAPRAVCELLPFSQEKNQEYDTPANLFFHRDESYHVRPYRRFADSCSATVGSSHSLRSNFFSANQGSQEENSKGNYEPTQDSSAKLTRIKKIFCCCDCS